MIPMEAKVATKEISLTFNTIRVGTLGQDYGRCVLDTGWNMAC